MLYTQPQSGPLVVDWENPITAGLSTAHILGYAKRFDAVRRVTTTATGTKTTIAAGGLVSGFGAAMGVASADRIATTYSKALTARATFFSGIRNGAGGGTLGRIYDKTNGSAGQFLYWQNSSGLLVYGYYLGTSEQILQIPGSGSLCAPGMPFTAGVNHSYVGTTHTIQIWMNGELRFSTTATGANTDAASTALSIGNRADGIRGWDGSLECGFIFDRILSGDEHRSLNAARYQLFIDEDEEDEVMFAPAAAPTGSVATHAATLNPVTAAAAGATSVQAAGAITLGSLTSLASGSVKASVTSTVTLGSIISTATGRPLTAAASAPTLGGVVSAAAGGALVSAASAVTLGSLATSGAGTAAQAGVNGASSSVTLGTVASTSAGAIRTTGQSSTTLGSLLAAGSGAIKISAAGSGQLGPVIGVAAGRTVASEPPVVPASRTVVFQGGTRVVVFDGGIRTVAFHGGTRTVRF